MSLLDFIAGKSEMLELKNNEKLEKKQDKQKLKTAKTQLKEVKEKCEILEQKYVALLEEKAEGFNQYLFWQNKAKETEADERELRREMSDIKKELKDYDEVISRLFTKESITSLAKCETYEDFLAYALRLHFTEKDLPLKGIKDTCKKLEITKNMIKKESEYLYKQLGVDKWDID